MMAGRSDYTRASRDVVSWEVTGPSFARRNPVPGGGAWQILQSPVSFSLSLSLSLSLSFPPSALGECDARR
ncbi:hypothetical protein LY76DRAFT_223872 [Colletotrichum caudatum]|nr:hypothetical protein LY76DRAFT_223872 [Colletotrichum caudatum]